MTTIDFKNSIDLSFYLNKPEIVAQDLIGKAIVKILDNGEILAGIICETEAYLSSGDMSSHSACGLTQRNAPMFAKGGILYVYKIYGVHHCINFTTEDEGIGSAVLIRALVPISGIETMQKNREISNIKKLCSGPGNLSKAFQFTIADNYKSLNSSNLFVQDYMTVCSDDIEVTERIGISKSKELPLRFVMKK